jgi:hypothetical protein
VIDTSVSMRSDLVALADVIDVFPGILADAGIDGRFAVVAFGTNRLGRGPFEPRLTLDFTADRDALAAAVEGLSDQIVRRRESGTEAMLFALDHLQFRPEAVRNLILITDEDDDRPASDPGGREPPTNWLASARTPYFQGRIDQTAEALIAERVWVNMVINPQDAPTRFQYGSPSATRTTTRPGTGDVVLDIDATLEALVAEGFGDSLQGQLLSAGLLARAFRISDSFQDPQAFWEDLFRLKATEVIPEPASGALLLGALLALGASRRRRS